MFGDEVVPDQQSQPSGVEFEGEQLPGANRRHRVAVRIHDDPTAIRHAHRSGQGRVVRDNRPWQQVRFFLEEEILRAAVGLAVPPHVGHRVQPDARGRVERRKLAQLQTGEEVFLE